MKILIFLLCFMFLYGGELIQPIDKNIQYDKAKVTLGELLFFDTALSKDESVSCASCHKPSHGWADTTALSRGVGGQKGDVNSPTILNAVFNFKQFWNGRAKDLSEQAKGPIHRAFEMDMTPELLVQRVEKNPQYKEQFKNIYKKSEILYDDIIDAIVAFEKTLITPDSKFDLYLRGEQELSKGEMKGYMLFKTFGCVTCHNGVNIGGNSFQKLGIVIPYDNCIEDRYNITKREFDKCVYKVPTLRNIEQTAPYFHDGSAKDLQTAIKKMSYHNLGFEISDKDANYIGMFLKTLSGNLLERSENTQ